MFKKIFDKAVTIANGLLNKYEGSYVAENLPESVAVEMLAESVPLVNDFYWFDFLEGVNAFGPATVEPVAVLAGAWDDSLAEGQPSGMALVTVGSEGFHLFTREDWVQGDTVYLSSFEAWYIADSLVSTYKSVAWSDVSDESKEIVTITSVIDQGFLDTDSGVWIYNPTETNTFTGVYVWGQEPYFTESVSYA